MGADLHWAISKATGRFAANTLLPDIDRARLKLTTANKFAAKSV